MNWLEDEVLQTTAEIVDALLRPTNEFVPRVESALRVFAGVVQRRLDGDDEPTTPMGRPPKRPRQETMELTEADLIEVRQMKGSRLWRG